MKLKLLVWILAVLILSSSVMAVITDNLVAYYKADEGTGNLLDATNNYIMGIQGTVGNDTVILNSARGVGTDANYFYNDSHITLDSQLNYSVSIWVKKTAAACQTINNILTFETGTGTEIYGIRYYTGGFELENLDDAAASKATTLETDVVYNVIGVWQGNTKNSSVYVNGTKGTDHTTAQAHDSSNDLWINRAGRTGRFNSCFAIDEIAIWDRKISDTEITQIQTTFYANWTGSAAINNFSVTATDEWNSSSLNISVWLDGVFQYTNTTVTTALLQNDTGLHNITIGSINYYNRTYTNYNTSSNLVGSLFKIYRIFNITFSNYITYSGINYTRNLTYSVNLTCPSFDNNTLNFYVSGANKISHLLTCINSSQIVTGSYQYSTEGNSSVYFTYNSTGYNETTKLNYFLWDLINPIATINFTVLEGFNNHTTDVTLICTDNIFNNITYNNTLNGVSLFYGNLTNASVNSNSSNLVYGTNTAVGTCKDLFGSNSSNYSKYVYSATLILIDERNNVLFDVNNVSSARVYYDDNSTYFDFKTAGTNTTNFTSILTNKLRFELVYSTGDVIVRYIDVSLLTDPIRVCANKEGVTHYEQLLISAIEKPVVLKNVFSNCVVAADYTRFAYQSSLVLKAYTINSLYYLYTFDEGNQVLLASLDGSISTYVNLDTLEFNQNAYDVTVLGDALAFEKTGTYTMKIYYNNLANDNSNLTVNIIRLDNTSSTTILTTSSFSNPNNFTMYFDFTTLNITNNTVFKIVLTKTSTGGITSTLSKYFNTQAKSGKLPSGIGLVIGFLLIVFGLTFTISRTTFSWFGIAMALASIIVLTFTMPAWYITFLLVIDVIVLVYIVIILAYQNYPTVA